MAEENPNGTEPNNQQPGTGGGDSGGGNNAPTNQKPTDGNPPAASGAATPEEIAALEAKGYKVVKDDDYKNLVSGRDRSNDRVGVLEQVLEPIVVEREITSFLSDNKDKFPDLSWQDLQHVQDFSQLEGEATRLQTRLQEHAQQQILDIENKKTPVMTEAEREAKIDDLRKSDEKGRFGKMLALRLPTRQ